MTASLSRTRVLLLFSLSLAFSLGASAQNQSGTVLQHEQRAAAFLKANQPQKAIPELAAVVAAEPRNADAQANLGVLLYFQQQLAPAVEHMRAALAVNPALPKIQALLGMAEYRLGEIVPARVDLGTALRDVQEAKLRKQVGLMLVELETAQSNLPAAAEAARILRQADPTDPEVLYATYRIYTDLASESLLDLSLGAPQSAQMQQAIGHELTRVRDLNGAAASFRRAIAIDPNLPGIHFELAEVLHASANQTERDAAEKEYLVSLEKNPRDVQSAIRLGDIHADRNEAESAEKFYRQALVLQPASTDALIGMARVQGEKGENDKAIASLQQALQNDPSNILAHYRLSALYRKTGKQEDARKELAQYQKLKELKEKLGQVYSTMKIQAPGAGKDDADAKSPPSH